MVNGPSVVDLLEYHELVPSRHTPPVPLVRTRPRAPAIKPAPVVAINVGTAVVHGGGWASGTYGVRRHEGVTYWQARGWA